MKWKRCRRPRKVTKDRGGKLRALTSQYGRSNSPGGHTQWKPPTSRFTQVPPFLHTPLAQRPERAFTSQCSPGGREAEERGSVTGARVVPCRTNKSTTQNANWALGRGSPMPKPTEPEGPVGGHQGPQCQWSGHRATTGASWCGILTSPWAEQSSPRTWASPASCHTGACRKAKRLGLLLSPPAQSAGPRLSYLSPSACASAMPRVPCEENALATFQERPTRDPKAGQLHPCTTGSAPEPATAASSGFGLEAPAAPGEGEDPNPQSPRPASHTAARWVAAQEPAQTSKGLQQLYIPGPCQTPPRQ